MTVAALLFAKTFPIVITDHLISTSYTPATPVSTVLTDVESRVSDRGKTPVGMAAKVWHVENDMYMIYAGTVAHALQIRDKVKAKIVYTSYCESIHNDITVWADAENLKASFILVFLGADGFVHHMSHGARTYQCPYFGDVLIIGTGEDPMLKSFNQVARYIQPLPINFQSPTAADIQRAMANAVALQANATVEYMKSRSEYASKATGGLFALSYLPKCYGWSSQKPPPGHVQNRVCELFTERRGSKMYLNRAVISSRTIDDEPLDALVYRDSEKCALDLNESAVLLSHGDWVNHHIAQKRADTVVRPFAGFEGVQDIHAVIVYAQFRSGPRTGYLHQVFHQSGTPLMRVSDDGTKLQLAFTHPMLREVWKRTAGY